MLRPFEIPRTIILEPNPFTVENGLLTPSFKLNRLVLQKFYKKRMENIYEELDKIDKEESFKNE